MLLLNLREPRPVLTSPLYKIAARVRSKFLVLFAVRDRIQACWTRRKTVRRNAELVPLDQPVRLLNRPHLTCHADRIEAAQRLAPWHKARRALSDFDLNQLTLRDIRFRFTGR